MDHYSLLEGNGKKQGFRKINVRPRQSWLEHVGRWQGTGKFLELGK